MQQQRWIEGRGFRSATLLVALVVVLAFVELAGAQAAPPAWLDGRGFEDVVDPAQALFDSPQLRQVLALPPGGDLEAALDEVYTLEHHVPIAEGQTLFVTEHFTLRSWLRAPRRVVLLLTGPEFRGSFWSIPVAGYNGTEMLAQRGFFAFAPDYVGAGESYRPADGSGINFSTQVEPMRVLLRYIRFLRQAPRIDLLGEGYGGEVASQLAADAGRVRSCVMSVMVYKDLLAQGLVSPEFAAFLASFPDGYFVPSFYDITVSFSPPEVGAWVLATQPGLYPTGPFWILFEGLPYFDPGVARAPGLVIGAGNDFVAGPHDAVDLAADYGTHGAELIVIEEGLHAVRIENPAVAEAYWEAVFGFIDPWVPR